MPTRILLLTFYYPPDLSAGSFRAGAFVRALQERHGAALEIDVVTTMPNRYQSYQQAAEEAEVVDGISVRRFAVDAHKSGFVDQSLCFLAFARQALSYVEGRRYDLVWATSSRLMTAALAAFIARRKCAPLYLDIRDLFIDTMKDVLRKRVKWIVLPAFRWIEKYTFRTAAVINVVSPGFSEYFEELGHKQRLRYFTNGVDEEFLNYDFSHGGLPRARPLVLYAGNIGAGQGLDRLIPVAARLLRETHEFKVVGDGGAKQALIDGCADLDNVVIDPPVNRERLKALYAEADILLMHLNDLAAFRRVLPSKVFEYAATGKPILAGVAGYAAEFTRDEVENAAVFSPCDAPGLAAALGELDLQLVSRASFKSEYARSGIMRRFVEDVLSLIPDNQQGAGTRQ